MIKNGDGIFDITVTGDLKGKFYTYLVEGRDEVTDPYSYAVSLNGIRSAIVDLSKTNPEGWDDHFIPERKNLCETVIYEVHIKDFTFHKTSNVKNRGKYLGFVEEGTSYNGFTTGIDHLKELGVTHVHLLPVYDFLTVKEEKEYFYNDDNYNWGYDPEHYNAPEGSYSLKPEDPAERIKELKTVIMKLHEAGMSVVLDVVYNHTYRSKDSNFNVLYPNYFYRTIGRDTFSNGSGCGNEIASERPFVREFIKYSLIYWLKEYKVDGFRFDLMGLMDIETMDEIVYQLKEIKEDILIYGEPWVGGHSVLPDRDRTVKGRQYNKGFALFNDDFRDAVKGDNDGHGHGFIHGDNESKNPTETGLVGSISYDDDHIGFAANAKESINYINSHDNLIIHDKITKTFAGASEKEILRHNKFALSFPLLAQGIPFIHAGNEFLRSKNQLPNTYNQPNSINAIDWSLKEKNKAVFRYVKDIIEFRKSYPQFAMCQSSEIRKKIKFLDTSSQDNLISYTMEIEKDGKYLILIFNANSEDKLMFTTNIKKHLSNVIKSEVIDITLRKVFGMRGIIVEESDRWSPYGIITRPRSTAIWEITINKVKEAVSI